MATADRELALSLSNWMYFDNKLDPFYAAGKKFIAKGTYDKERANKLFLNAVNRYYKQFARDEGVSAFYLNTPTRKLAATKLREEFEYDERVANPGINGNGWTPIHAIRFNEDGSVSLMGAHTNPAKLGTGERFRKLKRQLAAKGAYSPGGLARYIGVQKYGAKKFAELAAKGRRRAARRRSR